jgi:hypothetical protein
VNGALGEGDEFFRGVGEGFARGDAVEDVPDEQLVSGYSDLV